MTYQPHQSEDATLKPVAPDFTPEEARRGYAFRNGVQTYCCYGMYCEAGHDHTCRYADGVSVPATAVAAWEYENEYGNKFLTHSDPNKWHPHDQAGFKNFRPLTYGVRASREPSRLLTPRAWQMEAMVRAAKLTGSPEGELALVEAKRYGLMADELERITAGVLGTPKGGSDA